MVILKAIDLLLKNVAKNEAGGSSSSKKKPLRGDAELIARKGGGSGHSTLLAKRRMPGPSCPSMSQ